MPDSFLKRFTRAERIAYLQGLAAAERMRPDELRQRVSELQAEVLAEIEDGASPALKSALEAWLNER